MWSQNIILDDEPRPSQDEVQNSEFYAFGGTLPTQISSHETNKSLECEPAVIFESPSLAAQPLGFIDSIVKRVNELENEAFLTTGCKSMDKLLQGGVPCFGITEIFGESAVAKTQICLQLALLSQLPVKLGGLNSQAVYINTEGGAFPHQRLAEIASHFAEKFTVLKTKNPMDNIIVEIALDHDSLFACLFQKIPGLVDRGSKIRLIIVDSIAAVYRSEYGSENFEERTKDLRRVAKLMRDLSKQLKAAVVVVNQATSSLSTGQNIPALGLVWTNLVTTRLEMIRRNSDRFMKVVFAPHIPPGSVKFQLTHEGISSVDAESGPSKKSRIA